MADVDPQHDPAVLVAGDRLASNDIAEPVEVDPAPVHTVIQGAMPTTVFRGQRQLDQRRDRPVGAQHGVGQFEQRIRACSQTRVERLAEPRKVPQRGGPAPVVHTDQLKPLVVIFPLSQEGMIDQGLHP